MAEEYTVDGLLVSILASFGVPVARLFYKGNAETFITFQILFAPDVHYADDESGGAEWMYRIDLYSKGDYLALLRKIKRALTEAEFYGISVDPEVYERDTGYYHIPIETKYLEVYEDGNSRTS